MDLAKIFRIFSRDQRDIHPQITHNHEFFRNFKKNLPLHDHELVVFDTELTGFDINKDEIVAIGAVKIHNLHIPRNCPLFEEFKRGCLSLPSYGRHLDYCLKALELLPAGTVIMRLTCDTPHHRLAAPQTCLRASDTRCPGELRAASTPGLASARARASTNSAPIA